MEEIKTNGIVISETGFGEADKILTILSPEYGKLSVSAKGAKSLKSRHVASAQMFAYSSFVLRRSRQYFYISDSSLIECFYDLRYDVEKVALANYFCEILSEMSIPDVEDEGQVRLLLNMLYALNSGKYANRMIKAVFEFRTACDAGYLPVLDACSSCGETSPVHGILFDIMNGEFRCSKCRNAVTREITDYDDPRTASITAILSYDVLMALRYISGAPMGKILSFSLSDEALDELGDFTEKYLISHVEHDYKSLTYYKKLLNGGF